MQEIKSTVTIMKNALMSSVVDWIWPRKESVSPKINQLPEGEEKREEWHI